MRRDIAAAAALVWFWWAAACNFTVSGTSIDGGLDADDAGPRPTVGFVEAASLHDELSGTVAIAVQLSAPADGNVTVDFAFSDGTAARGMDYTATDGTLTFAPGETAKSIDVTIAMDGVEEMDETFAIELASPTGATLGASTHTATISANRLPRASVITLAPNGAESTSTKVHVTLDQAPTEQVSVELAIAGTATAADIALTPVTVTFPIGTTMQELDLGVVDDVLDEDDETVALSLHTPSGVVIQTTAPTVYTIDDDDPMPLVRFAQATTTQSEDNATLGIDVALSAVSGRDVTVPVTIAGTATGGSDYNVLTTLPLVIPAGMQTVQVSVQINEDTMNEPDETIVLTLDAPTNATLGGLITHTITVEDDDPYCLGVGAFQVCSRQPPTTPAVLPAVINTTPGSLQCAVPGAVNWGGGTTTQPNACFIYATTITMTTDTQVIGSRPLVLVASTSIEISQVLDAASHRGISTGPGAPSALCAAFPQTPSAGNGGGGGAGGSFLTKGGNGGSGAGGAGLPGLSASADALAPTVLRAGCNGQTGASSNGGLAGAPGPGGGAVYLVSNGSITVSGTIDASGAGAAGGGIFAGGSGAGSGGMIVLYAPAITATGTLLANGGGGASGGDNNTTGNAGQDPDPAAPGTPAAGGPSTNAGGPGGNGYAGLPPGTAATSGATGGMNEGGGGGGGGGGYIRSNLALTGATVSAGRVDAP